MNWKPNFCPPWQTQRELSFGSTVSLGSLSSMASHADVSCCRPQGRSQPLATHMGSTAGPCQLALLQGSPPSLTSLSARIGPLTYSVS